MTRRSSLRWLGALLAPLALASAIAVQGKLVGAAPAARPTLKFAEMIADKLDCSGRGRLADCGIRQIGHLQIEAAMSLAGTDPRQFNRNTEFAIEVGGYEFAAELGEDPSDRPGKNSARFVLIEQDDNRQPLQQRWVNLEWNARVLHATVEILSRSPQESVVADNHTAAAAGPFRGSTEATMQLGDASTDYDVACKGQVARHNVRRQGEVFNLAKVTVAGLGNRQ